MKNLELYLDDQLINSMYNDMDINSIYNNMDISSIEPHNIEPHNIEPPCPSEIKEDTNEFKNNIEKLDKKINKIKRNRNVARGRGRYKQLKTMTKDEIRKEQNQSLESNRLAAKKRPSGPCSHPIRAHGQATTVGAPPRWARRAQQQGRNLPLSAKSPPPVGVPQVTRVVQVSKTPPRQG